LFFAFITAAPSFGQTEIFNVAGGGMLPANWIGTNNVVSNAIDKGTYYLVDAGNPSDIIETDVYDLSAYDTAEFKLDVASFGGGAHNEAKIEISFDGGSSYTQIELSTTTTGSSYIDGGTFSLNSVTNQIKIKISNNGTTARGVRLRNLILLGYDANPLITVGSDVANLNYVVGDTSSEGAFIVEGSNLTNDIVLTPPTDFEISETSGSGFVDTSITLDGSSGAVTMATIYARLKSGLAVNSYSGDVNVTSTGATTKTISLAGNVFVPATSSLIISGVYDADIGNTPKGVELYVVRDIADLSIYGLGVANNGGGTDGEEYTFPADTATKGTFIYVTTDLNGFNAFFGASITNYQSGNIEINGDDAIELFESGQVIDVFGDINTNGSGEAWEYLNGWAYRNSNTGPEGIMFTPSNWTYSGVGNLDGATNAMSTSVFSLASFSTTLSTDKSLTKDFSIYPNPTALGYVNISSRSNSKIEVSIYDVLGKQIINKTVANKKLDVFSLKTGVYIVKVSQDEASITKKLVIQ